MNTSRTMKEEIIDRLTLKIPVCNGVCRRSPKIFGRYVLCWRCYAILGSFFPTFFITLWVGIAAHAIFCIVGAALVIPCAIDGVRQTLSAYESSNPKRVKTGLPAGVGLALITLVIKMPV